MQKNLVIILLVLSVSGFSQNHIDANGNKQGKWVFEKVDTLEFIRTSFDEGVEDEEVTEYKTYNKLEGEYLDNEKIGV